MANASDYPVGCINSHFLDSGSFTLWTKAAEYGKEFGIGEWEFYNTDQFWDYMDGYSRFVKENKAAIDICANIDVLPFRNKIQPPKGMDNASLTWRNQKWLEAEGLNPMPVVHYTTDLKWLKKYIKKGYKLIGLGGLVGSTSMEECVDWIDDAFCIVCDTKDGMPRVDIHGFGVTSFYLMRRYPWYSVDSTSWTKVAAYGGIIVPGRRNGKWIYDTLDEPNAKAVVPEVIKISLDSPSVKDAVHYQNTTPEKRKLINDWLEEIGVPLGNPKKKKTHPKWNGVLTHHSWRRTANLRFFERFRNTLPEYPWAFRTRRPKLIGEVMSV